MSNIIKKVGFGIILLFFIWFIFCLPKPLFNSSTSTVLYSENDLLLGAKIAEDGQWRFPYNDDVPEKFKVAIVQYEDQQFYKHFGFNPVSIYQAAVTNYQSGEIKRGGSTLSQQTIRLALNNPERTYLQKLKELIFAIRLEVGFSKKRILAYYSSNAPFGGNVVGLDAAAWRYFGRSANELSWAESATLAVLPNAPGLIHPGRNRESLKQKRDLLLKTLFEKGKIDEFTYELSIQEALPIKPLDLPRKASHLLERAHQENKGEIIFSSINEEWQAKVDQIIHSYYLLNKENQLNNAAAIIIDINTKQVKAYIGNTKTTAKHQNMVDMVTAKRSTGSLLKPFLFAGAIDDGLLLPNSLVADIPTYYNNYSPQNFDESYSGAIPASQALSKSLNVPAVRLLSEYGIPKFHANLQQIGLDDIIYTPSYYGLPLILGGAESSLWDLGRAYAGLASTVNNYENFDSRYFEDETKQLSYNKSFEPVKKQIKQYEVFSVGSIWQTLNALQESKRPNNQNAWEYFADSQKVAWKTGTSYGNKDAWAIGVSPNYAVAVWVGNADGEGRSGNTGLATAAPILFDIFNSLPKSNQWFSPPTDQLYSVSVCQKSGMIKGKFCPKIDTLLVTKRGVNTKSCLYHQSVFTSLDGQYRVNISCSASDDMKETIFFTLPPKQASFYSNSHADYLTLPPYKESCNSLNQTVFSIVYPQSNSTLKIPVNLSGENEKVVLQAAHQDENMHLFWYLNEKYIGETVLFHQIEISPEPGNYLLSVVDETGKQIYSKFNIEK